MVRPLSKNSAPGDSMKATILAIDTSLHRKTRNNKKYPDENIKNELNQLKTLIFQIIIKNKPIGDVTFEEIINMMKKRKN
jgi:hypothetical protein